MKTMPKTTLSFLKILIALGVLAVTTFAARAAGRSWTQATPGPNDWSVTGNWFPAFVPGPADTASFTTVGTSTATNIVNNVVSGNTTVTKVEYKQTAGGAWHVTRIDSGATLEMTNLTVGYGVLLQPDGTVSSVAMTGGGTLSVQGGLTDTEGNIIVGNTVGSGIGLATLDLSALSNFVYSAPMGTLMLSSSNRSGADMKFAAVTNNVTVSNMFFNTQSYSGSTDNKVTLGGGSNNFNVARLWVTVVP